MKDIHKCTNCGKKLRMSNARTLFSGSVTGAMFTTYLCKNCAKDKKILEKMQNINDCKLALADGEISVQEFNTKIHDLHGGVIN